MRKEVEMQTTEKVVYSCRELMQLLSLSKNAVYKAAKDDLLPGVIKVGGRILFSKSCIDRMLSEGVNPMERGNDNKDV
jgi:predicted DNA-binding transcriptional regulator AlpA